MIDLFPHQQNLIIIHNEGKKLKDGCISKEFNLGRLESRRGLDLTKASVAHRLKLGKGQMDQVT